MKKIMILSLIAFTCFSLQSCGASKYTYMNQKQIEKAVADNSIGGCFALEIGEDLEDSSIAIINIDGRTVQKRKNGFYFTIKTTDTSSLEYIVVDNYVIFNKLIELTPIDRKFYWFIFELDSNRVPTGKKIILDSDEAEKMGNFGNGISLRYRHYVFTKNIGLVNCQN